MADHTPPSPARIAAAALLTVAALLPVPILLDPAVAGPAGSATLDALAGVRASVWIGGAIVLLVGSGAAFLPSLDGPLDRIGRGIRRVLLGPSAAGWVLICASVAGLGAAGAGSTLLRHEPTLVDEMVQLAEARAIAGHQPEIDVPGAAIRLQNGLLVDGEWRSVYPPGHTLLLAASIRLGIVRWFGAILWATTVGLSALLFLRLGGRGPPPTGSHPPEQMATDSSPTVGGRPDQIVPRLAGLLLALSPMGWLLAGGTLSHLGAACAIALALVAAEAVASSRVAGPLPTLLAGVILGGATGWAVTSRPWTGLLLAGVLPTLLLLWRRPRATPRTLAGAVAGGLPFAMGLFQWNAERFGSPLRFGYGAAFGPSHGLGLHPDPWGNLYGLREAVGYSLADLQLIGSSVFAMPAPLLLLLGIGLLLAARHRRSRPGLLPLATAWIALAVAGNAAYWHHGVHFGPRMLFETLPAWALLTATILVAALSSTEPGTPRGRAVRVGTLAVVVQVVFAGLPDRLESAAVGEARLAQLPEPESVQSLPDSTVVVVHGSWASRVAARLAEAGVRADSIETALRRNDLCAVSEYATARARAHRAGRIADPSRLPELDWSPLPGTPTELVSLEIAPGVRARVDPDRPPSEGCRQEAAADRFGGLELEALRWRTDRADVAWIRDLGPSGNRLPGVPLDRVRVLTPTKVGGPPVFLDYEQGMSLLWGFSGSGPGP